MVDTSPPTVADPLAASDSGTKRSAASAASCTSDRITPASAPRALSSPETERILRIRRIERSSARPSASGVRSDEHTSELQSLLRISYAVSCFIQKHKTHKRKQ